MAREHPLLIAGLWKRTDEVLEVRSPFDGAVVGETYLAGEAELEDAIQGAQKAFMDFKDFSAFKRGELLFDIVSGLEERSEELATTIASECGKPIKEARAEVARAQSTFRIAAEEAKRIHGELVPLDVTSGGVKGFGVVRRFGVGPVLAITPFNFPLNLVAHKVAPALAAGNPVIIKPSPKAPLSAFVLGEIIMEATGLPSGALSVLNCSDELAGRAVADERIRKITFTGSDTVGWRIKALSGTKKVTLELGGNAGVIVDEDADVEYAAMRCARGAFAFAGQVCISVQRIYVHRKIYNAFRDALVKEAGEAIMGDPLSETTTLGPLIDSDALERTEELVRAAIEGGAECLAGGERKGNFFTATVLGSVNSTMGVCRDEAFAPVVTIEPFEDYSAALASLNNSKFGLQAGIFTRDIKKIMEAYEFLDVGGVIAGDIPTFRVDNMPYGGIKDSGFGREGVKYAIEEMTEPKLLILKY
jgi:glyceraldehyde-3-phosphate dehydrogenase (NADP+)